MFDNHLYSTFFPSFLCHSYENLYNKWLFVFPYHVACAAVYDPVCGCDGKTYGNGCEAGLKGAEICSKGPCNDPPIKRPPPRITKVCYIIHNFNATLKKWHLICFERVNHLFFNYLHFFFQERCPKVHAPVCCKSGVTYSNACQARLAGDGGCRTGICLGDGKPAKRPIFNQVYTK